MNRRRQWIHKSVKALMELDGGNDPEQIIREKARAAVEKAKRYGWAGPPFQPTQLASVLGIKCQETEGLFSEEAQLRPIDGNQLLLEFNPERAPVRRNYSVCHEIVHTFFPDCFEMVRYRRSEPLRFDPEQEVEDLCQIGASELLMPIEEFQLDLEKRAFSLEAVPYLSDRYQASREAVIRRMVTLSDRLCAVVFFSRRHKPAELKNSTTPPAPPMMRVIRAIGSPNFPVFMPEYKSVPDESCVSRAAMIDSVVSAEESWDLPEFGLWRIEAMGLPVPVNAGDDCPTVMALVHAE